MKILCSILIFIFGLIFGSFFSCISYRIPNKISTIKPNSFCPKCKNQLKWYMNIPVFSYLFLKGKCFYCKEKIGIVYLITELGTGILFLLAYLVYGFSYNLLIAIVLESVFIIVTITDLKYFYISDRVLLIGLILILILDYLSASSGGLIYKIISSVAMFGLMYLIKVLGDFLFKKESLGGGDIKLMALVGASVGFIPSLIVIFLASVLGLIYSFIFLRKKDGVIPFGPFILLSTLIIWYINLDFSGLALLFR